jgi:hypothetical protein
MQKTVYSWMGSPERWVDIGCFRKKDVSTENDKIAGRNSVERKK